MAKVTITFDCDGGTINGNETYELEVDRGSTLANVAIPEPIASKASLKFKRWEREDGKTLTGSMKINSDITVRAIYDLINWIPIPSVDNFHIDKNIIRECKKAYQQYGKWKAYEVLDNLLSSVTPNLIYRYLYLYRIAMIQTQAQAYNNDNYSLDEKKEFDFKDEDCPYCGKKMKVMTTMGPLTGLPVSTYDDVVEKSVIEFTYNYAYEDLEIDIPLKALYKYFEPNKVFEYEFTHWTVNEDGSQSLNDDDSSCFDYIDENGNIRLYASYINQVGGTRTYPYTFKVNLGMIVDVTLNDGFSIPEKEGYFFNFYTTKREFQSISQEERNASVVEFLNDNRKVQLYGAFRGVYGVIIEEGDTFRDVIEKSISPKKDGYRFLYYSLDDEGNRIPDEDLAKDASLCYDPDGYLCATVYCRYKKIVPDGTYAYDDSAYTCRCGRNHGIANNKTFCPHCGGFTKYIGRKTIGGQILYDRLLNVIQYNEANDEWSLIRRGTTSDLIGTIYEAENTKSLSFHNSSITVPDRTYCYDDSSYADIGKNTYWMWQYKAENDDRIDQSLLNFDTSDEDNLLLEHGGRIEGRWVCFSNNSVLHPTDNTGANKLSYKITDITTCFLHSNGTVYTFPDKELTLAELAFRFALQISVDLSVGNRPFVKDGVVIQSEYEDLLKNLINNDARTLIFNSKTDVFATIYQVDCVGPGIDQSEQYIDIDTTVSFETAVPFYYSENEEIVHIPEINRVKFQKESTIEIEGIEFDIEGGYLDYSNNLDKINNFPDDLKPLGQYGVKETTLTPKEFFLFSSFLPVDSSAGVENQEGVDPDIDDPNILDDDGSTSNGLNYMGWEKIPHTSSYGSAYEKIEVSIFKNRKKYVEEGYPRVLFIHEYSGSGCLYKYCDNLSCDLYTRFQDKEKWTFTNKAASTIKYVTEFPEDSIGKKYGFGSFALGDYKFDNTSYSGGTNKYGFFRFAKFLNEKERANNSVMLHRGGDGGYEDQRFEFEYKYATDDHHPRKDAPPENIISGFELYKIQNNIPQDVRIDTPAQKLEYDNKYSSPMDYKPLKVYQDLYKKRSFEIWKRAFNNIAKDNLYNSFNEEEIESFVNIIKGLSIEMRCRFVAFAKMYMSYLNYLKEWDPVNICDRVYGELNSPDESGNFKTVDSFSDQEFENYFASGLKETVMEKVTWKGEKNFSFNVDISSYYPGRNAIYTVTKVTFDEEKLKDIEEEIDPENFHIEGEILDRNTLKITISAKGDWTLGDIFRKNILQRVRITYQATVIKSTYNEKTEREDELQNQLAEFHEILCLPVKYICYLIGFSIWPKHIIVTTNNKGAVGSFLNSAGLEIESNKTKSILVNKQRTGNDISVVTLTKKFLAKSIQINGVISTLYEQFYIVFNKYGENVKVYSFMLNDWVDNIYSGEDIFAYCKFMNTRSNPLIIRGGSNILKQVFSYEFSPEIPCLIAEVFSSGVVFFDCKNNVWKNDIINPSDLFSESYQTIEDAMYDDESNEITFVSNEGEFASYNTLTGVISKSNEEGPYIHRMKDDEVSFMETFGNYSEEYIRDNAIVQDAEGLLENIDHIYKVEGITINGAYTPFFAITSGNKVQIVKVVNGKFIVIVGTDYSSIDDSPIVAVRSMRKGHRTYIVYKNQRIVEMQSYLFMPNLYQDKAEDGGEVEAVTSIFNKDLAYVTYWTNKRALHNVYLTHVASSYKDTSGGNVKVYKLLNKDPTSSVTSYLEALIDQNDIESNIFGLYNYIDRDNESSLSIAKQ